MTAPSDDPAAPRPARRAARRLRAVLLLVFGPLLALLIAIPVLALVLDVGGMVRKQLLAMKPDWERRIGRAIAIGDVKLRLLPSISAEVRDVAVAAQPPADAGKKVATGDAPLVRLGAARLGVAVLPLLRGEVRISYVELQDLAVTVVRGPDGQLSYQDILDRLASDQEPSKPLTPEQLAYLKRLSLSRVAVIDAALRFQDLSVVPATTVAITRVNLRAEDVALGRPLTARLHAAVLAAAPNLDVTVKLAPLPADLPPDLKIERPLSLVQKVQVKVLPLQLDPLLRFLPPAEVQAASALLDCDMTLETPAAAGQLQLKGQAGLRGLTLTHLAGRGAAGAAAGKGETVGVPTDLRLAVDLTFALLSGDLALRELVLAVNDMEVRGQADARALWTAPRVQALALASRGLLLERLLAVVPPGLWPRGATLRGPLSISARGSGDAARADLQAEVDLTAATVQLPALSKPPGTALSASFRGALLQEGGSSLRIDRLGLTLGPLALLLSGVVRPGGDAELKLDSGSVALDGLLRLLPPVQRAAPAGTKLAGALQVAGRISKKGPSLSAQARVGLSGADMETDELALSGGAELTAKVQAGPGGAAVDADVDLDRAHLLLPGAVDKAAGVPMNLHLAATTAGEVTTIKTASLKLPGGDIAASGSLRPGSMDLRVPTCDLDLGRLSRVLPPLRRGLPPGLQEGRVKLQLALSGDPADLRGARARLSGFELRAAGGQLGGEAEVLGLSEPQQVTFRFAGQGMDLSRLAGADGDGDSDKKPRDAGPVKIPPLLRRMALDGRVRLTDARYQTSPIKELLLEVTLSEGRLLLKTLRGAAFSGQLDASGSAVELAPTPPRFDLRAAMNKVELSEVLALRGDRSTKLTGRGDVTLAAKGTGLRYEDIAPAVTGSLVLGLSQGRLHTTSLVAQVVNPLLEKLQDKVGKQRVSQEMALRDLSARFHIANGRLTAAQPLTLNSDEGALRLGGSVGLDQRLALTGELQVAPQAISAASGGRVVPSGPLPVSLRIGGTLKAPEIEVVDLPRTAAALAGMLLKGRAKGLLEKLPPAVSDRLGGAGAIPTSSEDLQKKAQEEAQAAQQRAQEEARKRAQEAEQRLREEARKRLGGLGGILGN